MEIESMIPSHEFMNVSVEFLILDLSSKQHI